MLKPRAPVPWTVGLVLGAAGGIGAATLECVRALPPGLRLWAFLASLYGCVGALAGLALGAVLGLLLRATVLGPLLRGEERSLPRWALAPALLLPLLLLGAALYGAASFALLRFHHRVLIAVLVGGEAALLLLPAAALGLLVLAALAFRRPRGPLRVALRGPFYLYALGWAFGLWLAAAAAALLLLDFQKNPRMNAELRALNLALWGPAACLAAVFTGHLAGRTLAARGRRSALPAGAQALVVLLGLLAPLLVAVPGYWDTLRILDLRPFTALGCGLLCALGPAPLIMRIRVRLLPALLLIPLLWGLSLGLARSDRVRKAALSQTALCRPLLLALQQVFDLDRDGFPAQFIAGGTDCDDLDPAIHPGAFDWPGNDVDENCNGHKAELPDEGPRPFPPLPSGVPPRLNVVLLTIDALRADHVGCYGYGRPTTPLLDALAKESIRFGNAWAHAPSTRYSVPAILTGRYPSTIAWGPPSQHWPPEVLPENRLLSEMLHERGYRTMAALSYHYFEPTWGLARGFDDYDYHLQTLHSMGGDPTATSGSSSRELADLIVGKLQAVAPALPFFLWAHFYDPHYRYQVHPEVPTFGPREEDQYDNEIRYTDLHLGRVLDALRQKGLWERTLLIVTADHGEGFGEHGIPPDRRHGYHLYANQTRVPLLIRVPGLPPRVVGAPAGHVDLWPTVLHLLGGRAEQEPQLLGHTLVPLLTGADAGEDRVVFQEVMYEGPTERKAVVTSRWHYIRNVIPDGTSELYNLGDLGADPREERDLQGEAGTDEAKLARLLAAWMDQSAIPRDFARKVRGNMSDRPFAVREPIGALVDGSLEVVGVDLLTPAVARGETAEVAVVLHARSRVAAGQRLFMHLRDEAGGFLNADHDLLEGLLPVAQLRPGTYVRDAVKLRVPPTFRPGRATLVLGLFHGQGRKRAPVSGPASYLVPGENAVRVATIEIR